MKMLQFICLCGEEQLTDILNRIKTEIKIKVKDLSRINP